MIYVLHISLNTNFNTSQCIINYNNIMTEISHEILLCMSVSFYSLIINLQVSITNSQFSLIIARSSLLYIDRLLPNDLDCRHRFWSAVNIFKSLAAILTLQVGCTLLGGQWSSFGQSFAFCISKLFRLQWNKYQKSSEWYIKE